MTGSPTSPDPLNELAEEFVERFRRGERPSLTEYTSRYPELENEIRDLFPALVMMEDLGSVGGGQPGPSAELQAPEHIGDFRILREIGRGGMGVVYEAVQESLGRHVALKILPPHHRMDGALLERFQREARAAAGLHHTNIVPVFGVGDCEGIHYYAMQYIQGQSLDEVIAEVRRLRNGASAAFPPEKGNRSAVAEALVSGAFNQGDIAVAVASASEAGTAPMLLTSPSTGATSSASGLTRQSEDQYHRSVARIGVQAAEALEYAHRQGVLHRDIKPSNLLLDLRGTVWIADFGLAKAEGSSELTHTGDIVGTLRYMAPERIDGHSERRSDIYGLGITLYELLTLRPAFSDTQRARLIQRIQNEEPAHPRKSEPAIPLDLETIVLKAIAKNPADRYTSAEALAGDLRRFLADRPIQARRAMPWERAWRWCRRNPMVASLAAAVLLLGIVASLGIAVASLLRQDRDQAFANLERAEKAERELQIRTHLARATAYRRGGRSGQRFLCLEEARAALALHPSPDTRAEVMREVIGALALPDLYHERSWEGYPAGTNSIDFDDHLEIYARTDRQGTCSIRRVASDKEVCRLLGSGQPAVATLSRNGRFVALAIEPDRQAMGTERLQIWKLIGSQAKLVLEDQSTRFWLNDFRPDGRLFASAHADGSISVYDLDVGRRIYHVAPAGLTQEVVVRLHPSEPIVAVCSYFSKVVQLRDLRTGAVFAEVPHPSGASDVAWHPTGGVLATTAGNDTTIQLYAYNQGRVRLMRELDGLDWGSRILFNHSGDRLVSFGWLSHMQLWDVGSGRMLFSTPPVPIARLRFHRDDEHLAGTFHGRQVGIWRVGAGRERRVLVRGVRPAKAFPIAAAVHPDGRWLAAGWTDGLGFWDLATGAELAFVTIPEGVNALLFDPSGALLTNGVSGLLRWSIRFQPGKPGTLRIGPPQALPIPHCGDRLVQSDNGQVLVESQRAVGRNKRRAGAWVFRVDQSSPPLYVDAGADVFMVAVSPDGHWVATGRFQSATIKIWDASNGRLVRELTGEGSANCRFTPDGRWLATELDECQLYEVGTWAPGPRLGAGFLPSFAPDGNLAAMQSHAGGGVRLVAMESRRDVAYLEDPSFDPTAPFFTPDGTHLIAMTQRGAKAIHVWDLRAIRGVLDSMGLDWDQSPFAPIAEREDIVPLNVEIDRTGLPEPPNTGVIAWSLAIALQPLNPSAYYHRALDYATLSKFPEAVADCFRAKAIHPNWPALVAETPAQPHGLNRLAWELVVRPRSVAEAEAAVVLARRAVTLDPSEPMYHNTLGVASYRAGQLRTAVAELSISLNSGGARYEGFDCYFLAMCYHAVGNPDKARTEFHRAVAWRRRQKHIPDEWAKELDAIHAEAATLVGIAP